MAVDDARGFSAATLEPVLPFEANDSLEEQFKRRMGMRNYFKQLNMSLVRIRNAKLAIKQREAKKSKGDIPQEEHGEMIEIKGNEEEKTDILGEEVPTTAPTNPPMKKKKGKKGQPKKGKQPKKK